VGTVKFNRGGVIHVRSKASFLVGVGVGYVLGAKAGEQRYEQIKSKSQEMWQSDPVQAKVSEAAGAVKAAAPVVTEKVSGAAKHAGSAAKHRLRSDTATTSPENDVTPESAGTATREEQLVEQHAQ
jgi:hypothetical protein